MAFGAVLLTLLGSVAIYLALRPVAPSQAQFLQGLEASAITVSVDRVRGNKSSGSGFFISRDGLALTNAHVVTGAVIASGSMIDGNRRSVRLVALDKANDIAELQLDGAHSSVPLPLATSKPQLGEEVYVIGNPLGALPGTITKGYVAGLDRQLTVHSTKYQNLVQLDVSVSPGNSGGPVIDSSGAVIGMLTLGTAGTNQAFAIPASTLGASITRWTGLAPTAFPFPFVSAPSDQVLLSQEDLPTLVVRPGTLHLSGYAGADILTSAGAPANKPYAQIWLQVFPSVQAAQAEFQLRGGHSLPQGFHSVGIPTVADESEFDSVKPPNLFGLNYVEGAWRDRNVVVTVVVWSSDQAALDGIGTIVQAQQQRLDDY